MRVSKKVHKFCIIFISGDYVPIRTMVETSTFLTLTQYLLGSESNSRINSEAWRETTTSKYLKVSTHFNGISLKALIRASVSIGNNKAFSPVTVEKESNVCKPLEERVQHHSEIIKDHLHTRLPSPPTNQSAAT